ncbi:transglutaminaseTgpA domain-containing protein [Acinetobacter sp. ANC 4648]|uniref:transglutaminase family protein n=1 Tax=Acinetobacter sp. ANC 4648 TaxID=1977875 RepID=UPI000A33956C|nr:DUF3488 and transglutaminase-like domain-containing protein [Acinetobacter sp. ANC 4648]OTG83559.1 transglutaminase [Acinetobacter sp. ANC 4648]
MNRAIQISIILSLSLILVAQLAFIPIALSLVFLCMILNLVVKDRYTIATTHIKFFIFKCVKIFSVIFALGIIYLNYKTFLGVDAGMAVLAAFLYAKALETKNKRDLIILFNFALFVSAGLFLYSQSIWMALLVFSCLVSCLVGLYRIQTSQFEQNMSGFQLLKTDIQHILKVIALAVPFFILLFLFFPRLPPLWQIPVASSQGVTGMSDRMSPGEIAELSQSSALAFRILGDMQQLPKRPELYWRAIVLDQYDGTTWTSSENNQQPQVIENIKKPKWIWSYQYLAADDHVQWVMALERSIPAQEYFQLHQDGAITPTQMVQRTQPIKLQWLGSRINDLEHLSKLEQDNNLNFIQSSDPQAQQLARDIFTQSHQNPAVYIQRILQWYQQNNFSYTLAPGKLGNNRIDTFLFQSKQGFCEHYASSFAMLMRYVGIPARVVLGYQGGQLAPDRQSWEVRQLDAHAWTEVYLQGKWHRYDPTFIIAPQRIDQGMQDYISEQRLVLGGEGSTWRYPQYSMLKSFNIWSDYASYQWQSKVVGYDAAKQNGWLEKFGLNSSYRYALILIFGTLFLGAIYFVVYRWNISRNLSALDKVIHSFSKSLSAEHKKMQSETFQQWMLRLSAFSDRTHVFEQVNTVFQKIMYLEQKDSTMISFLEKLLKECATELKVIEKTCQDTKK